MGSCALLISSVIELEFLVNRWVLGNTEEDFRVLSGGEISEVSEGELVL